MHRRMGGLALLVFWLGVLGATAPGCGASGASICERACDCTGCSESELDDCVDAFDEAEKEASDESCQERYDAYVACLDDDLKCDDEEAVTDDCGEQAADLADCLEVVAVPGIANACDILRGQCAACGDATELCLASVDLLQEIGGTDACQEALDAGGVQCGPTDGNGGNGPGG